MIALWIMGAPGSGKSTFVARHVPPEFRVVDQDAALEQAMIERGLPLDISRCDSAVFEALRAEVTERVWRQVPVWRQECVPIAFQVSGDKPDYLRVDVDANRAAGYRNYAIAIRCPLEVCLRRNRERARVLPDFVVERIWIAFEENLASRAIADVIGPDALFVIESRD